MMMMMTVLFVTLLNYRGPLYNNIAALSGPSFSLPLFFSPTLLFWLRMYFINQNVLLSSCE
jgi:hypothetical protein